MISLKPYQQRVLDTLRHFLCECVRTGNAAAAFASVTQRFATASAVATYVPVQIPGLSGLPYVCLRLPTGGGKTLLACHAAGIALRDFRRTDHAIVLWLVPSNTILEQTKQRLSDLRDPYRRALEVSVGGPVEVLGIEEALRLSRPTADGETVVIVATIQGFRVEDTTGRKVYDAGNSALSEHFADLAPATAAGLESGPDGRPAHSLANVLRLRRPIVIVDEAHNARTNLSFATLGRLAPACILEFTATPARENNPSNVLHRVSAAELKAAEMIKLPIRVVTRPPGEWARLLAEALTVREDLEKLALREGQITEEYLRPIALLQAQSLAHTKELRIHLEREHRIPADQIKICTSEVDELKSVANLLEPSCPVRFIITVQKLREGWDCPFAYVLCSLQDTRSATAIEQLVGRVLRLPSVRSKQQAALNQAYAFSVSNSLPAVLGELKGALELNGFTGAEAERIVVPAVDPMLPLGSQPRTVKFDAVGDLDDTLLTANAPLLMGKVSFDRQAGTVTVNAPLTPEESALLTACFTREDARREVIAAAEAVKDAAGLFAGSLRPGPTLTPFERQESFLVPLLALRQGELLEPFERTHLLEHPWRLSEQDAALGEDLYPSRRPTGDLGQVDVAASGQVTAEQIREDSESDFIARLHQQVWAFAGSSDWTLERLIQWLDQQIPHADLPAEESAAFLRDAINGLVTSRGLPDLGALVLDRHRLRDALERKIATHRNAARKQAFQAFLLDSSGLTVQPEAAIDFSKRPYEPAWFYEGSFRFKKHYYPHGPGELKSSGEECECAVFLDGLEEVKFWVRNLARKPGSFSLQVATGTFYPDFVCRLHDGRVLVVEYKGKPWYQIEQSEEKRAVGAVWEGRSNGRCLFIMPDGPDLEAIRRKARQVRES